MDYMEMDRKFVGIWRLLLLAALPLLGFNALTSCSTNEDTEPSLADEDRMEQLIDEDIPLVREFRDKNGTYILYRFDKNLDFAYQFEQASNWNNARIATIGKEDAEVAVGYLDANIFSCYNDDYRKRYFPRKLLLVSDIASSGELGMSVPVNGHHTAVANINSVTFASMDKESVGRMLKDEELAARTNNEYHRALLADYLVKARGEYPVGDEYFAYCQSSYSSLMNSSRKTAGQLLREDGNFFLSRGFFNPEDDESTYFPGAEDDILSFISNMITMDAETANELLDIPVMAGKMHLITSGLQRMGVDVMRINPNMEQFIRMEYVQPAVMFAADVVTDNPKATLEVTILRGSHALSHLVVYVNGQESHTVDLKTYDKMRVIVPVELDGLVKGANAVTLKLYEEGRDRSSFTLNTGVSFASLDQVIGLNIKRSDDHEDVYRVMRIAKGSGGNLDNETNPDLITVSFEKHGWLDRYFMENDAEYRYWKMYQKDGRVETVVEYLQDGFNEDYTAPLYRIVKTYTYIYNSEGELTEVSVADENGKRKSVVTDVAYMSGRIIRYSYDGKVYEPVYATVDGVTTRVDCLDADMSGKCFGFTGSESLNPYYIPELPAVIPGFLSEVPLQLLYSKYLFCSLEGVWNGGWTKNLEDKVNAAVIDMDGVRWTYRFKLK